MSLSEADLRSRLADLPDWTLGPRGLERRLAFPDFGLAFAFMCRVALLAERLGHHPEMTNSYRRVSFVLVTHEAGGVTERDLELAAGIDALLAA